MTDFKKHSDVAAPIDDASPVPMGPGFAIAEDVPATDDQSPDNTDDKKTENKEAAPYWHPAWESVAEKFQEKIDAYDGNNVLQFKDLSPEEFQQKVLVQQAVRSELIEIMEDVRRAVQSVEQQPSTGKRAGTKG